jgi:chemotaxis protein methyltransferase CheR
MLQRYMTKRPATHDFVFRNEVRSMIEFQHLNLMNKLPTHYRCSVIFCRNIMIYFDKPTQQDLVSRLAANLEDGGYLFIGHAESLNSIEQPLEYVSPSIYRKPGPSCIGPIGQR